MQWLLNHASYLSIPAVLALIAAGWKFFRWVYGALIPIADAKFHWDRCEDLRKRDLLHIAAMKMDQDRAQLQLTALESEIESSRLRLGVLLEEKIAAQAQMAAETNAADSNPPPKPSPSLPPKTPSTPPTSYLGLSLPDKDSQT